VVGYRQTGWYCKPCVVCDLAIGLLLGLLVCELIRLAIIGMGLIFVLLAYLDYQKWIKVDWGIIQTQTSNLIQKYREDSSAPVAALYSLTATLFLHEDKI
jgi:uncharacterized membrane protein (Fun14 family)